eukprot:Tbor_TRINITY_DN1909_c0_g1::TRINITY_DN1909_c0_g1_i1::g.3507::m.3507
MTTAIEKYFNKLIDANTANSIVLSDIEGKPIIECFGSMDEDGAMQCDGSLPYPSVGTDDYCEGTQYASNCVISAGKSVAMFKRLQLGVPSYIAAQYHDQICVHFFAGGNINSSSNNNNSSSSNSGSHHASVVVVAHQNSGTSLYREPSCIVTLVGRRSAGHSVGSISSYIQTIEDAPEFKDTVASVTRVMDDQV